MPSELDWLCTAYGQEGDAQSFYKLAKELERSGNLRLSATAYDRAYGLDPKNKEIALDRMTLLDNLSIVENGIRFRYIPSGTFLMGSDSGDPDEQPVHPVKVDEYWLSETPVSWAAYSDLMDWGTPPDTYPKERNPSNQHALFFLREENKIRMQYCEDETTGAKDWHAHAPDLTYRNFKGEQFSSEDIFGSVLRNNPRRPWKYDQKPMVSVSWQEVEELCKTITNASVIYRMPTEAEWEKAARGGLINCIYSWGNEHPNKDICDYDRFNKFSIFPTKIFPPNDYGLFAMNGCVWEWTSDWYDATYYAKKQRINPQGPVEGDEKVLRGGSWSDCSEAVTVSFRMSRPSISWKEEKWGGHFAPNIGFRLCRVERP